MEWTFVTAALSGLCQRVSEAYSLDSFITEPAQICCRLFASRGLLPVV